MIPGNANPLLLASAADAAAAAVATKSLRFNSDDSAYLNRTPSSAGNRKTFTFSAWVKKTSTGSTYAMLGTGTDTTNLDAFDFNGEQLRYTRSTSGSFLDVKTDAVFRDPSAWYHVVLAVDTTQSTASNRVKLYVNGAQQTSLAASNYPSQNEDTFINSTEPQVIGRRSAHQDNYFDGYMADAYLIDGSQLDPTSFGAFDDNGVWQASGYSGTFGTNGFHLLDFANEATIGHDSSGNENDFTANNLVAGVGKVFTTAKIYSVYASATVSSNYSVQYSDDNSNWTTAFSGVISNNGAFGLQSGTNPGDGSYGLRKYWRYVTGSVVSTHHPRCSRIVLSDGVSDVNIQVFTSDNTSDSGTIPAEGDTYTYTDTTAASTVDVLFDSPQNDTTNTDSGAGGEVSGNYCTLNPLVDRYNIGSSGTKTFSEGNLKIVATTGDSTRSRYLFGTIGVSSGKWYYEMTADNTAGGIGVGFAPRQFADEIGSISVRYNSPGSIIIDGTTHSSLATFTNGDVIGVALDLDNNTVQFYKNGSTVGSAYSVTSGYTYLPLIVIPATGTSSTGATFNFGQRAWAYSAPSNHKALCTTNLPTPTIADGSDYFDVALYDGTGTDNLAVTSLSFQPEFVWIKARTDGGAWHYLFDVIRGVGKGLFSNTTNAEISSSSTLKSFDSNGFTVGTAGAVNRASTDKYVGWCWDAGSSTISNTDGTITTSQRVNQSAGFSISTYTGNGTAGATFGHGLNAVPDMIIIKARDSVTDGSWIVGHSAIGLGYGRLLLNSTAANNGTPGNVVAYDLWNNTAATSSVVSIGSYNAVNDSGDDYVAYCFTAVAGYSAFGSYEGNGSADGPFVYCGFKPRWIMMKNADTGGTYYDWRIIDTARHTYNEGGNEDIPPTLFANKADAELDWDNVDILSNGFKIKDSSVSLNQSGATQIFIAFAENPFQANGGLAR